MGARGHPAVGAVRGSERMRRRPRRPGSGLGGITRAVEGGRLGDGPTSLAAREERRPRDGAGGGWMVQLGVHNQGCI